VFFCLLLVVTPSSWVEFQIKRRTVLFFLTGEGGLTSYAVFQCIWLVHVKNNFSAVVLVLLVR
jgi:hypothetical protein